MSKTVAEVAEEARDTGGIIVHTVIMPELRRLVKKIRRTIRDSPRGHHGADHGGLVTGYARRAPPEPGLVRRLDAQYFRRVEAIEFAVKYDDGKDPRGWPWPTWFSWGFPHFQDAPEHILAHKQIKVANVPLVPEIQPPEELFRLDRTKVVGLTISPNQLYEIRKERLLSLGLHHQSAYASLERILEELEYAEGIMKKIGCPIFDVTNKAVEETAGKLLELIRRQREDE